MISCVAVELDLRKIECRLRLRESCLCRIDLRLEGTRIDHKQELPLLQVLAVLEMPLDDASATCGVTVTDSKAAFLPISSRYLGTSCAVALTTVTSGGGMAGGAACTLPLLQAAAVNSNSAGN